jgi:hypothetical protein
MSLFEKVTAPVVGLISKNQTVPLVVSSGAETAPYNPDECIAMEAPNLTSPGVVWSEGYVSSIKKNSVKVGETVGVPLGVRLGDRLGLEIVGDPVGV